MTIISGGVEVHPWASISGHSPIPDCNGETFHSPGISSMWRKVRMEFIANTAWKISGEIIPMVVLVTNRVEEGGLGMVTTFCHHDQAKVEPSEVLSTIHQCNSPEPSIVVVKIFTNSPYFPWGSFSFPYLDVTTLLAGMLTTQFPLAWLHLCRILSIHPLRWSCNMGGMTRSCKVYPFLWKALWESSEEDHCLSEPVLLLVPHYFFSPHWEESSQTEEELGLSSALTWLHSITQAKAQLEWELAHEWESWPGNMRTNGLGWPWNMRTGESGWPKRWMQPSKKPSLKQSWLTQSGYFPNVSPPPILTLFPYVTWVGNGYHHAIKELMPQWLPLHQSLRDHKPQPPQAVLHIKLRLHLFPFFHVRHSPYWHSLNQMLTHQVHHWSLAQKGGLLTQWCTWPSTWQEDPCQNCRGQCQQWV